MVLDPVSYRLELDESPGYLWRVHDVALTEQLSATYSCLVTLTQHDPNADPEALIGTSCQLTLARGTQTERRVCGIIRSVRHHHPLEGAAVIDIEIVPALMALAQRTDSRIFQSLTVPQIVDRVLSAGLQPYQRTARQSLNATYAQRDYCVQYRETDLAFVQRLLAEEGIGYYFDHSGSAEEMVLFDGNASLQYVQSTTGATIDFVPPGEGSQEKEVVQLFEHAEAIQPTSLELKEYDWMRPTSPVRHQATGEDAAGHDRPLYDPAPALVINDGNDDGQHRLQARTERDGMEKWLGHGEGTVSGFTPGYAFDLAGHPVGSLDQKYVVVEVHHRGEAPDVLASEKDHAEYHNRFVCLPASVPYRPQGSASRPRMPMQTATVVGPAGEEIYTDDHGRIKVKFHWDRAPGNDEHSSCWMRVAQVWAGPGYGAMYVPRIGMEVVVGFVEADPDQPLVTGVVYNGRNLLPFNYPGDKTKTGLITRSSPNGSSGNELWFEDAADNEQIYLQATKDWKILVKNDQDETVNHNATRHVVGNDDNTIDGNHTETITGTDDVAVTGDRSVTVQGSYAEAVTGNMSTEVDGNSTVTVQGNRSEDVAGNRTANVTGNLSESVTKNHSQSVNGNQALTITKNRSIDVSGEQSASVTKNASLDVGQNGQASVQKNLTVHAGAKLTLEADKELTLKCGSASIVLKSSGNISVEGAGIEVKGSGSVKIKGSTVTHN